MWKSWSPTLTHKAPSIICSKRQFQILPFFQKEQIRHDITWESSAGRQFSWNIIPYFFRKLRKVLQNLSSAAVVIGALRVNFLSFLNSVAKRQKTKWFLESTVTVVLQRVTLEDATAGEFENCSDYRTQLSYIKLFQHLHSDPRRRHCWGVWKLLRLPHTTILHQTVPTFTYHAIIIT